MPTKEKSFAHLSSRWLLGAHVSGHFALTILISGAIVLGPVCSESIRRWIISNPFPRDDELAAVVLPLFSISWTNGGVCTATEIKSVEDGTIYTFKFFPFEGNEFFNFRIVQMENNEHWITAWSECFFYFLFATNPKNDIDSFAADKQLKPGNFSICNAWSINKWNKILQAVFRCENICDLNFNLLAWRSFN